MLRLYTIAVLIFLSLTPPVLPKPTLFSTPCRADQASGLRGGVTKLQGPGDPVDADQAWFDAFCGTIEAAIADIAKQWGLKPSVLTAQATETRSVVEPSDSSVPAKPVIGAAQLVTLSFSWSK